MNAANMLTPIAAPEKASRESLARWVADDLREAILSGKLAPGEMVAEIPTAERLGVSRVPVREATLALEHEGLLVLQSNGRRRVRILSGDDFREIYSVRRMLEVEAFRLAAIHHTPSDIASLNANVGQMQKSRSLARLTFLDIEFHTLVAKASQNSRLLDLFLFIRGQIQLFTAMLQRELSQSKEEIQRITLDAHREGIAAIQSRDEGRAARFACTHIEGWFEHIAKSGLPSVLG